MKVFMIVLKGYDTHVLMGVYTSKELAEEDLDFIGENENKRLACDETYQERWIKIEDEWHNQSRSKFNDEPWPSWEDTEHVHTGDKISIEEHEVQEHSYQSRVDAINAWQNNGMVHPLTCGNDSSHPNLTPYFGFYPLGVGIECTVRVDEATWCAWRQRPDDPVLDIVYASYLSNRTSPPEAWWLRSMRETPSDPSPHEGPPEQAP